MNQFDNKVVLKLLMNPGQTKAKSGTQSAKNKKRATKYIQCI